MGHPKPKTSYEPPTLFAWPYDTSKDGFFIKSLEQYEERRKISGGEEFEISIVSGTATDIELFKVLNVDQTNIGQFFESVETLEHWEKLELIFAGEYGFSVSFETDIESIDCESYEADDYLDLVQQVGVDIMTQFVRNAHKGELPGEEKGIEIIEYLFNTGFLNEDQIAHNLKAIYRETTIGAQNYYFIVHNVG